MQRLAFHCEEVSSRVRLARAIATVGLVLAGWLTPAPVCAQSSVTATMNLDLTVDAACTVSVSALNLGSTSGAAVDGQHDVTVNCSSGTSYQVAINGGNNVDGTSRRLADGSSNHVGYFIYQDAAKTSEWGDSGTGSPSYPAGSTKSDVGSGADQTHTAYVATQAFASGVAGSYSDTVTVKVTF